MRRAFVFLTLSLCAATYGDEIYLQNGDRVSGLLQEISPGAFVVDTPYAGQLTIAREAVAGVTTEAVVTVFLQDGGVTVGRLVWGETGQGIDAGQGPAPLPLEHLAEAVRPGVDMEPEPEPEASPTAAAETAAEEIPVVPSPWSGMVESGLSLRSGNTDTTDFTVSAKVMYATGGHELTLKAAGAYGEADGLINTRRASGEARWQYYTSERSYLYMLGGAERDDGRKLDLRLSAAAGAGYDFLETETRTLSADAGLEYTWARWEPFTPWGRDEATSTARMAAYNGLLSTLGAIGAGGVNLDNLERLAQQLVDVRDPLRGMETMKEDSLSLRLGAVYTQKLFKLSTLSETLTLYPNLEQAGEFRGISEFAFATPLTEALELSVTLRTEYDSLAEEQGVDAWDNSLVTGLRYKF
jgi:hypothetical protein